MKTSNPTAVARILAGDQVSVDTLSPVMLYALWKGEHTGAIQFGEWTITAFRDFNRTTSGIAVFKNGDPERIFQFAEIMDAIINGDLIWDAMEARIQGYIDGCRKAASYGS